MNPTHPAAQKDEEDCWVASTLIGEPDDIREAHISLHYYWKYAVATANMIATANKAKGRKNEPPR